MGRAIFLRHNGGPGCVRLEAVMHPLTAMCDGISYTLFGKSTKPYMLATEAIKWCEIEGESHDREEYEQKVKTLKMAIEQEAI